MSGCHGCELILRALPRFEHHWDMLSAMRGAYLARRPDADLSELVFVVGEPSILPDELQGRGEYACCVVDRRELVGRYRGPLGRLLMYLAAPATEGMSWIIASIAGDASRGENPSIVAYQHRVPDLPSDDAAHLAALALVPADGAEAPGARINAPGGRA